MSVPSSGRPSPRKPSEFSDGMKKSKRHDAAAGIGIDGEEAPGGLAAVDGDVALVDEVVELVLGRRVELGQQRRRAGPAAMKPS